MKNFARRMKKRTALMIRTKTAEVRSAVDPSGPSPSFSWIVVGNVPSGGQRKEEVSDKFSEISIIVS